MSLVRLKGVSKIYDAGDSRIAALDGVDLEISEGEFVAVWGPSGSGKTTLCNLIGTLDKATSGEVELCGRHVAELHDDARTELRNDTVGFIFQDFNLLPVLTALENVMLPLQIRGASTGEARREAERRLAEVGLERHLHQRPDKLSGGQQQRVAIARALLNDPEIVLADEPTANLDTETALHIIEMMRRLNEKERTTFVFATPDRRLLDKARRRIGLRDGRIVSDTGGAQVDPEGGADPAASPDPAEDRIR
jgi:putative ABC transport system ATP-binding protein